MKACSTKHQQKYCKAKAVVIATYTKGYVLRKQVAWLIAKSPFTNLSIQHQATLLNFLNIFLLFHKINK